MAYPVAPVVMPADLTGQTNGKLDSSLLTTVEGGGKLHHLAARAWNALVADAWQSVGLPLTYTYGGTYRSYSQQETLFRSRYAIGATGGGCKLWDSDGNGSKESWCKKSSTLATAAVPGTSNHGWGLAVDSAWDKDLSDGLGPDDAAGITSHPGWQWLLANAERYGFSWELQSEPWHLRYVTGDSIPQAVLDFEGPTAPPPPIITPPPTSGDDDMAQRFILTDARNDATYLVSEIGKTWVDDGNARAQLGFRVAEALGQPVDYSKPAPPLPDHVPLTANPSQIDGFRYAVILNGDPTFIASYGPIIGPRPAGVDEYGR